MKRLPVLVLFMILTAPYALGQQFGLGAGYGTANAIYTELFYGTMTNRFHIGITYQFRNTRGKLVEEQLPNYGQTIDGTGSYYIGAELGFGHVFRNHITLNGEVTLASRSEYTNYIDNRFTDGGYHMIDKKGFVAGFGGHVGYIFLESFEVFAGYNTLRKFTAGIRVLIM